MVFRQQRKVSETKTVVPGLAPLEKTCSMLLCYLKAAFYTNTHSKYYKNVINKNSFRILNRKKSKSLYSTKDFHLICSVLHQQSQNVCEIDIYYVTLTKGTTRVSLIHVMKANVKMTYNLQHFKSTV